MDHRSRKYIRRNSNPPPNKIDLPRQPRQMPQLRGRRTMEPSMHQLRQQTTTPSPPEPLPSRRRNHKTPREPRKSQRRANSNRHRAQPRRRAQRQTSRIHAVESEAPGEG